MNRDEFTALPAAIALGILYDTLTRVSTSAADELTSLEKPRVPFPPKYDQKVYRKGGWNWASEMDLAGLQYWHGKAEQSAQSGGQYAEKDRKKADQLARWIAWRTCESTVAWSGERGDRAVTAATPSSKPRLWTDGDVESAPAAPSGEGGSDDVPF